MVPSFVHELDVTLDTEQWGRITFDLSYGGIFYALVDVGQVGLTIEKGNARALVEAGMDAHQMRADVFAYAPRG